MNQMLIYLAIGLAVILAGIGGFSAIGKKEKKDLPDSSQRDLVYSCGDEALIQFYEAAATDEEREQIAGFAAELIARNQGLKQAPGEEVSDLDNVDMDALRAEMEALGSMTGQIVVGEEEALDLTGAAAGLGLISAGVAAASRKAPPEEAEEAEDEAAAPAPDLADLDGLGLMLAGVTAQVFSSVQLLSRVRL